MPKEDKIIWALVLATVVYFAAHVAWTLMQPWVVVAANALPK